MKLSKEQAAQNRQAIIEAAAGMFRERGVDGVGLNDLMKAAGFTHGGFYNHFMSKEALAAEAFESTFKEAVCGLTQAFASNADGTGGSFRERLQGYLSTAHRDDPGQGCPTAALVVDAARQGEAVQAAYARGIECFLTVLETEIARELSGGGNEDESIQTTARECAIGVLSALIGGLVLSRAVAHAAPALSDEILSVNRKRLKASGSA